MPRSLEYPNSWRQKVERGAPGAGEAAMRKLGFKRDRVSVLPNVKGLGMDGWCWLYNNVNGLNAAELYP